MRAHSAGEKKRARKCTTMGEHLMLAKSACSLPEVMRGNGIDAFLLLRDANRLFDRSPQNQRRRERQVPRSSLVALDNLPVRFATRDRAPFWRQS